MIVTGNAFHLGDNLVHLHFLRACAKKYPSEQFGHWANAQHRSQLQPLVDDLPNLKLLDACPEDAVNAWRGAGDFWYLHSERHDFVKFHCDWFHHLAGKMGIESPRHDLMFDYPALAPHPLNTTPVFDVLLINSIPQSGQFRAFNPYDFTQLAKTLTEQGKKVISTFPTGFCDCTHDGARGLSVTAIGRLSTAAKAIVGCVTGPAWPCMNVWNKDKKFIWLLDSETVGIMPNTRHAHSCEEAVKLL